MTKYEPLILHGTLEHVEALLFSFRDWKPSTGEKFKIDRLEWSKELKVPEKHAMWRAFTYDDSGIPKRGLGLIQATEIGKDRTRIEFEDGKTVLGEHAPVGKAFGEYYEAVKERLESFGKREQVQVSAAAGDRLDRAEQRMPIMVGKGNPQQPKPWHGNGQPPKTTADKIAAIEAWDNLNKLERPPLEEWLELQFGSSPNGDLTVPPSTFHGWRRLKKS